MYEILDIANNVKSFVLKDSSLFIADSNIVREYFSKTKILHSEKNLQNLKATNEKVFINTNEGLGYLINSKEYKYIGFPVQFVSYPFFLSYVRENGEKSSIIKSFEDESYFRKIEGSSTIFNISNEVYYRWNFFSSAIEVFSFPAFQPHWQFNLLDFGEYDALFSTERRAYEVAKFLGIWQDELLVACEGGLILSLNIRNGKLIRQWEKLPEKADAQIKDVFKGHLHQAGNTYQLNLSRDKIFAIYYRHLVEIDLTSGEIEVKDLTESLFKNNIAEFQSKSGYAEDETHYYTTVHFDKDKLSLNYVPTAVCAVNKETLEIDWYYRFDEDGSGNYVSIQIPQVSNQKLFQHTANKVLFVFEKEKP